MDHRSRMEVEAELFKLCNDFIYFLDARMFEEMIALFTPDGVWGRISQEHHGQEEIRAAMKARPNDVVTRHVSTNFHFVHIDDTTVNGVVSAMTYHGPPRPNRYLPGTLDIQRNVFLFDFQDVYKKTAAGAWRFSERIAHPTLLPTESPLWKTVPR